MTSATPMAKRRALLQELASRHVRLTAQRRLLLSIIQHADRHLDAAALLAAARRQDPRVNRATVYRTLALLKRLALVDELDLMHLEGEKHFYEAKRQSEHMHLACFRCGRIIEYSSPTFERLKAEIVREQQFSISVTRLEIGGICADCRAGGRGKSPAPRAAAASHPA